MSAAPTVTGYLGKAAKAIGLTLVVSIVVNLLVFLIARAAGADLVVQVPGQVATEIGVVMVVAAVVLPVVAGGILLLILGRWTSAWTALAIIGLTIGVISVFAPVAADAGAGTKVALSAMHVVTGVVWFVALRRGSSGPGTTT